MSLFECENQLRRDKDSILEGYVVESVFRNTMLKIPYTSGWWYAGSSPCIFFVFKEQLNETDISFYKHLKGHFDCWQVIYEDHTFLFKKPDEETYINQDEFVSRYSLEPLKKKGLIAQSDKRHIDRQNLCIRYFYITGELEDIAHERKFADDFLFVYFWTSGNLDFIVASEDPHDDNIYVIELKYKFPTRNNENCINIGELNLYMSLIQYQIRTYNIVMRHKEKDSHEPILKFVLNPENELCYEYKLIEESDKKFNVDDKNNRGGTATGDSRQKYFRIPRAENYSSLENYENAIYRLINKKEKPQDADSYFDLKSRRNKNNQTVRHIVTADSLTKAFIEKTDDLNYPDSVAISGTVKEISTFDYHDAKTNKEHKCKKLLLEKNTDVDKGINTFIVLFDPDETIQLSAGDHVKTRGKVKLYNKYQEEIQVISQKVYKYL